MAIRTLVIDPEAFGTGEEVRDALLALSNEERRVIITNPAVADFRVIQIDGTPRGSKVKVKVSYDDEPVEA